MKRSYLDYAMSVIVGRALPDVRDGLEAGAPPHPVRDEGDAATTRTRPTRKCAAIVGDVMGKYHPHGDTLGLRRHGPHGAGFLDALPLVDGQGNFGSMDGDPPAAMRYTEARLAASPTALLEDIDKETVDFRQTTTTPTHEPTVLPARFPNLLVNGAGGIAVGMATNIPPHNLGEVIDATMPLVRQSEHRHRQRLIESCRARISRPAAIILGRAGIPRRLSIPAAARS